MKPTSELSLCCIEVATGLADNWFRTSMDNSTHAFCLINNSFFCFFLKLFLCTQMLTKGFKVFLRTYIAVCRQFYTSLFETVYCASVMKCESLTKTPFKQGFVWEGGGVARNHIIVHTKTTNISICMLLSNSIINISQYTNLKKKLTL